MITTALLFATMAIADEGMWMPEQLPELSTRLAEMGLEIPADQHVTCLGRKEAWYWELIAEAEAPGVDFKAEFMLPIYAKEGDK